MSDNGAGQYQALRVEVESVKGQFHDFKEDVNGKLAGLSDEIRSIGKSINDFIQAQGTRGGESFLKIGGMMLGVATITLTVIGAFGSLAKSNLDTNIAFTNDKIATTSGTVRDLASTVRDLANTTIPRPELEFRINSNREAVLGLSKTIAENVVPRTEFEKRIETVIDDITSLKENTLKRADLDGRFGDFTKRLDLISNRVEILQQTSAGTAVLQEQLHEAQEQIKELRTRILACAQ